MTSRTAPRRHQGLAVTFGHFLAILATIGVVWMAIALHLRDKHAQIEAATVRDSANLARAFDENIVRVFEAVDQILVFVRQNYLQDPGRLDLATWASNGRLVSALVTQVAVIGPDGMLAQTSLGPADGRLDLSDREHFRIQREAAGDELFISAPVFGRVSGLWTLNCTRRVAGPDGSFRGVVVFSLDIGHLTRFYESIDIGNGVVLLAGLDGIVRAHAPASAGTPGRRLDPMEAQEMLSGAPQGAWRSAGSEDGADRLFSYRRVAGYPLVVAVGLDMDAVLAPYRHDRLQYIGVGACLTVLIGAAGLLLMRQRRRLVRSQAALAATLENVSQGVMMIDATGRVPVVNRRAVELLDLPPELLDGRAAFRDIVRHQIERGEFGPPDRIDPEFFRFLDSGGISQEYGVYERVRPGGIALEIRTQQLPDGGAVRTYTDVTDRRHNEEALAAARDAAEAAGRARSEFLAMMSHEMRTPLNGIIGVAGLLLDMKLDPTEAHYVRIVLESGNHLLQLINDILDFARLDAGRLELDESEFDLHEAVRGAVDLLAPEARAKGIALTLEFGPEVPMRVHGDARRLRQVLLNLVGNAVKFTECGSVRVTIWRLRDEPGGVRIGLAVADTGIGIPPEAQGKLFSAFTQVDSSVSRRFGGSGLGLAISRRLVERMAGTIEVESVPGQGSTFRADVLLRTRPAEESSEEADGAGTEAAPPRRGLRVLVAEDNPTNRLVVTRMLERMGHHVSAVTNGAEAVAALSGEGAELPDVVLMDVMMPEMDGLAATSAIRALPGAAARVPIVGLTANAMRADEVACLSAGMDHFATKPISADRLGQAIGRAMRARERGTAGRTAAG